MRLCLLGDDGSSRREGLGRRLRRRAHLKAISSTFLVNQHGEPLIIEESQNVRKGWRLNEVRSLIQQMP